MRSVVPRPIRFHPHLRSGTRTPTCLPAAAVQERHSLPPPARLPPSCETPFPAPAYSPSPACSPAAAVRDVRDRRSPAATQRTGSGNPPAIFARLSVSHQGRPGEAPATACETPPPAAAFARRPATPWGRPGEAPQPAATDGAVRICIGRPPPPPPRRLPASTSASSPSKSDTAGPLCILLYKLT